MLIKIFFSFLFMVLFYGCSSHSGSGEIAIDPIPVMLDTDANNELDDQHAMAYLLMSSDKFNVKGITVNATLSGGNIDQQYAEAERVMKLSKSLDKVPLLKGANANFDTIALHLDQEKFDGVAAVNFIIEEALNQGDQKLTILAVGKLTNVALAVKKNQDIIQNIRLVWLGSNYPDPGEYNLINDIPAMNYLLSTDVRFEMVTVRYGKPSGTDAVQVTKQEAFEKMGGLGPQVIPPIPGRHGGTFDNFGDYSISLFEHIDYHGDPPSRALFDMAAVAIVKNPDWATAVTIPAPKMEAELWVENPGNQRKIVIWENFQKEEIIADFYHTLENYVLPK